jgi:hypothetical protein
VRKGERDRGVRVSREEAEAGRKDVDAESEDEAMTLFKRHFRRVAGVGVGVALLVLGLEAPAFAATPTIGSLSPTSGPSGCVVAVTGTNFKNPNVTSVKFGAATAATFTIQSDTELWTTVPAGLAFGATTITIDNGSPPAAVSAFTVTDPASSGGGCVPTITSFTPTCGLAGASVVITGTNLLKKDDGTGGDVRFAPYPALPGGAATHSNAATESPTSLTVFVPTGAADGPIRVSTFNDTIGIGAALSATVFDVPPPDCTTAGPTTHKRSVTLRLSDKLSFAGNVKVADGFAPCRSGVPVKFQRKVNGTWKTLRSVTTTVTGKYAGHVKNKHGKFRALAPKVTRNSGADVCSKKASPVRSH